MLIGPAIAGDLVINGGELLDTAGTSTGPVVLNSNRGIAIGPLGGTIAAASSDFLAYGGIIADSSGTSNLIVSPWEHWNRDLSANTFGRAGGTTTVAAGTAILSGTNAYTGGSIVNGGILELGASTAIPASGTITVNSGGTVALLYALNQAFLDDISSTSAGMIALAINSSNNLDFSNDVGGANLSLASLVASARSLTPAC